jgi:2-dehydropantoate 2-reductase
VSRYVIIGAGALGALLAAQLHAAGVSTVLVARGENLAVIQSRGLTVHRPEAKDVVRLPVVVAFPSEIELDADDVIVLGTKTQDVEATLQEWSWQPVAGGGVAADLPVVTMQNGLAAEDSALRRFGTVYGASLWIAVSYLVPGEIVSPGWPVVGIVWIGALGNATLAGAAGIAADLERAGYRARAVDDIRGVKAQKLLGNLSNALDLFAGTADQLGEAREHILSEARLAYAAAGIVPVDPTGTVEAGFAKLDLRPVPGQVSGKRSTWQSFARGAGSEIDFLNGEIVLLGRLHDVETPVNERVQRVLGVLAATGGGAELQDISTILPLHATI